MLAGQQTHLSSVDFRLQQCQKWTMSRGLNAAIGAKLAVTRIRVKRVMRTKRTLKVSLPTAVSSPPQPLRGSLFFILSVGRVDLWWLQKWFALLSFGDWWLRDRRSQIVNHVFLNCCGDSSLIFLLGIRVAGFLGRIVRYCRGIWWEPPSQILAYLAF